LAYQFPLCTHTDSVLFFIFILLASC
jgi:hypothetical protein